MSADRVMNLVKRQCTSISNILVISSVTNGSEAVLRMTRRADSETYCIYESGFFKISSRKPTTKLNIAFSIKTTPSKCTHERCSAPSTVSLHLQCEGINLIDQVNSMTWDENLHPQG